MSTIVPDVTVEFPFHSLLSVDRVIQHEAFRLNRPWTRVGRDILDFLSGRIGSYFSEAALTENHQGLGLGRLDHGPDYGT